MPASMLRYKHLPVMKRMWPIWASFALFLDRAIELALFVALQDYQARTKGVQQLSPSYLDIHPFPAGITVFALLVAADIVLYQILNRIVPAMDTDNSYSARMLGIDFMGPRLAFFFVLWLLRGPQQTMCHSSVYLSGTVIWLMVRSWYAEIKAFEPKQL